MRRVVLGILTVCVCAALAGCVKSTAPTPAAGAASAPAAGAASGAAPLPQAASAPVSKSAEEDYSLGIAYADGRGVPQDYCKAQEHYEKAVQAGHMQAHTHLAVLLLQGLCKAPDTERARTLLETAAKANDAIAQFALGSMYRTGQGVPRDLRQAAHWYDLSAKNRYLPALTNHALLLVEDGYPDKDPKKAFEMLQVADKAGDVVATFNLGQMYAHGVGAPKDIPKAIEYYKNAADRGHMHARTRLGMLYVIGQDVERDMTEGLRWLETAARQGDMLAMRVLEDVFANGKGVPKDPARAAEWRARAAQLTGKGASAQPKK